jgi:hypothetical protein
MSYLCMRALLRFLEETEKLFAVWGFFSRQHREFANRVSPMCRESGFDECKELLGALDALNMNMKLAGDSKAEKEKVRFTFATWGKQMPFQPAGY